MNNKTLALLIVILIILLFSNLLKSQGDMTQITGNAVQYVSFNVTEELSVAVTGNVDFGLGRVYENASSAILYSDNGSINYTVSDYVALYRFDNANGSNATWTPDEAGLNNGTVVNAVNGSAGKINEAYSFGGNAYINLGNESPLTFGGNMTVSVWISLDSSYSDEYVVTRWATDTVKRAFALRVWKAPQTDCIGLWVFKESETQEAGMNCTLNFETDEWYLLTATFNTSTISLFVDGDKISDYSLTTPSPIQAGTGSTIIGADEEGARKFNGKIDEVLLYNYSFEASEVESLYDKYNKFFATNGTWYFDPGYIYIENDGTVNISVNYTADKNAGQFIGGTAPSFKIKGLVEESEACPGLDTSYQEVPNSTETPKNICPLLKFENDADIFKVPVMLVVPDDIAPGSKNSTITFSASKV